LTVGVAGKDRAMPDVFSYREGVRGPEAPDVVGFEVEASDGHVGRVDEATYETGGSHLVVDVGGWIHEKRRLIPAGVVQRIDSSTRTVHVAMSKDAIKHAPDHDATRHRSADEGYRDEVSTFYDAFRPIL
jgi:hypothetical protein